MLVFDTNAFFQTQVPCVILIQPGGNDDFDGKVLVLIPGNRRRSDAGTELMNAFNKERRGLR